MRGAESFSRQHSTARFSTAAVCLFAVLLCTAFASSAHAQEAPPRTADELFELGELEAARRAYQENVEAGGNSSDALAFAYRRLGVLAAIVNDPEQAMVWFDRSLALDPSQTAPAALAPSQRSLFVSVQQRRQSETAELTSTHTPELGHASLRIASRNLPEGWVHQYRVSVGSWSELGDGVFRLGDETFAASDEVSVHCEALDAHGNVLLRASSLVTRRSALPMPAEEEPRSRKGLWIGLTVLAVVGIAAAIVIPLSLRSEETSSYGVPVIEWP